MTLSLAPSISPVHTHINIVGPWLAFMFAALTWGFLILYRFVKAHLKIGQHLVDLPLGIAHLLLIMGGNFLILAILQIKGAFWTLVYILLSCCGAWFLKDIYNMYTISKLDIDENGHFSKKMNKNNGVIEDESQTNTRRRRVSSIKEVVGFNYPRYLFGRKFRREMADKFKGGGKNEQVGGSPFTLEAEDIYADFDSDFTRILLLGLSQMALLGMYVYGVLIQKEPKFSTKEMYGYYYGGVFIQAAYIVGNNKLQAQFDNFAFWVNAFRGARLNAIYDDNVQSSRQADSNWQQKLSKSGGRKRKYSIRKSLLKKNDDFNVVEDEGEEENENVNLSKLGYELWMRFLLSSAINSCGLLMIMILLPLQLSWSEDPTEFVLNAIAAFFIVELDDVGTPVVYHLIMNDVMRKELESDSAEQHCTDEGHDSPTSNSPTIKKHSVFAIAEEEDSSVDDDEKQNIGVSATEEYDSDHYGA